MRKALVAPAMGALAQRLAYLARRYGSDAAAWQHEIHAVAALEESDPRQALERFHALKRRFAEFRRAQLLDALRAFPFALDVPGADARGYEMKELEADIREATRALAHARAIDAALREEQEARASLRRRALPEAPSAPTAAAWTGLARLADATEARRRVAAREARLDRRLVDVERRAAKLTLHRLAPPDAALPADALDAALADAEARLDALERVEDAHRAALDPLRAPEVASYKGASRRALEAEARALAEREDVAGLRALAERAEALRREAAALASQAARSRRKGLAPPERERRAGDTLDGYG